MTSAARSTVKPRGSNETCVVERANYEAIYSNMPLFGLAKATEHVPAVGRRETARRRLMRGENEPAVPNQGSDSPERAFGTRVLPGA
jgi:hypothetical protein